MWIEKRLGSPYLVEVLKGGVWYGLCYSLDHHEAVGEGYYWKRTEGQDGWFSFHFPTQSAAMRWIKGWS